MDNLRSGVFRGERGKKDSQTKGKKDHLIKGWATDFYGLSLRRYTVFDCFNVVALSPVNGGLLIKNTCPVTEKHIRD